MFDLLQLSDADRYAIWTKGISKEYAYINFCDAETKSRFNTMRKAASVTDRRNTKKMFLAMRQIREAGESNVLKKAPFYENKAKDAFEEFENELKDHMIKAIHEGVFIALGYEHPRHMNDAPKPVPFDVWYQHDPWSGDSLKISGSKITDVRITLKRSVQEFFTASDNQPRNPDTVPNSSTTAPAKPKPAGRKSRKQELILPTSPKLGRPTKEELIIRAFDLGIKQNIIDCFQSKKTIYHQVLKIIHDEWPDQYDGGEGLGNTPMRKYLSKRIDANRL